MAAPLFTVKKKNKHKILDELYRLTWSSLESHLKYMYMPSSEGKNFHRKCVKDYAKTIYLVSQL